MSGTNEELRETRHEIKKIVRRLKLIFDELEGEEEISSDERVKMMKDFEGDMRGLQPLWEKYKSLKG